MHSLTYKLSCKSAEAAQVRTTYHGSLIQSEVSRSSSAYVLPINLTCCYSFGVAFWYRLRQCEIIRAILHFTLPRLSAVGNTASPRFYPSEGRNFTKNFTQTRKNFTHNLPKENSISTFCGS